MYNNRQKLVFFKAIQKEIEEQEVKNLLNVYTRREEKGLGFYERDKIDKLTEVTIDNPDKICFLFILLCNIKSGTLEKVGELVAQKVDKEDFNILQDYLYKLKLPKFELEDYEAIYDHYMKS